MSNVEAFARAARMVQMFGASAEQVAQAFEFFGQHEGAPMREQVTRHSKVFMWRDVLEVVEENPELLPDPPGLRKALQEIGGRMSLMDLLQWTLEKRPPAREAWVYRPDRSTDAEVARFSGGAPFTQARSGLDFGTLGARFAWADVPLSISDPADWVADMRASGVPPGLPVASLTEAQRFILAVDGGAAWRTEPKGRGRIVRTVGAVSVLGLASGAYIVVETR